MGLFDTTPSWASGHTHFPRLSFEPYAQDSWKVKKLTVNASTLLIIVPYKALWGNDLSTRHCTIRQAVGIDAKPAP
jgi:hypothetical protein